jgi:signal transduction histidine kinase
MRDEFLDVIERESGRLTRLTRALLVLARAGARDELPHLGTVRIAPLLEQVAASLPPRSGVEIEVDCPRTLSIVGDSDLLEQALSNVATNAVQHTEHGKVVIRGRGVRSTVVIEVSDTGRGIAPRDHVRIFDRFYRARDEGDDGFGLGLSIAREAVRTLGGEIELESEPKIGTTVRITLNRAPSTPRPTAPSPGDSVEDPALTATRKGAAR